jgi:TetR/AcrR family transcriptional regulator
MSDNREVLLKTAMILFAEHGYDAVGVQQIVEEAGVTKPTLYHYFESKHGLLKAIVLEQGEALLRCVNQAAGYDHNLTQTITTLTHAYFSFAQNNPTFYRMILSMSFAPVGSEYYLAVADLQRRQYTIIEHMFLQATHDHGNMRGRAAQYAITFKGMIDSCIGLNLQGNLSFDDLHFIQRVIHQYMHGIFS